MARRVQWRQRHPDAVTARVEEAVQKTFYIVHQPGPTSFVLKEEGKERKFKTSLGDIHQCSCSVYRKDRELCTHILWVLLKRFRVSRENPIMFQLGLVEREINEILHGNQLQQSSEQQATPTNQPDQSNCVVRRAITQDDVCPICQEEFSLRAIAITYCKFGCGQNVHVKCMKIWGEHQQGSNEGDPVINCPICRGRFASLKELCRSDLIIYKPPTESESDYSALADTHKRRRRDTERVNRVISQLRAYPLDGVRMGRGGTCEMCGEVYRRGDWLKRLPCRHKFHRECIDQWLKAGSLACPIDGTDVSSHKQQSQRRVASQSGDSGSTDHVAKCLRDNLSISGTTIKLPKIPLGVVGMVKSIAHAASQQPSVEAPPPPPHVSHDVSCDRSHDATLPPLQPSLSTHPHHLHTTQTTHPHTITRKMLPCKGLPSQHTPHNKRRKPLTHTSHTGLLVSCLTHSHLSPPPPLPPPHSHSLSYSTHH